MSKLVPKKVEIKDRDFITLRSASKSDASQLLNYLEILLKDGEGQILASGELSPTLEEEKIILSKFEEAEKEIFIVAIQNNQIVGNIDFHIGSRLRLSHAGWFGMAVHPDWRKKGIGKALLKEMLFWAQNTEGIEKVNLRVLAQNEHAIALYKSFGFKVDGRKTKEVKLESGGYYDDISMELHLN